MRNRARSGRFPNTLCGVVYQPRQFPFARNRAPENRTQWLRAIKIAAIAVRGVWREIVPDALFFHSARISPGWNLRRLGRVGNNVFYR